MAELPKAYVSTLKYIQAIHNCVENKKVSDEVWHQFLDKILYN